MKLTSLSIKTRVTLIVTAAFIGLLALASLMQMHRVKAEIAEVVGEQQLSLVSRVAEEIDDKLATDLHLMATASRSFSSAVNSNADELQQLLDSRAILRSIFDGLFVISAKGVVLADSPSEGRHGLDVSGQENFQQTIGSRKPHVSRPFRGRANGQPIVTISAPIFDEHGDIVGVLTGSLNLLKPNVLGSLATANVGKTGWFSLLGRDRTVVVSRDADRIMTDGPPPGEAPYYDHATAGQEGWEIGKSRTSPLAVYSYKPLKNAQWVLIAALPVEEAFAPVHRLQQQILAVGLVFAFLVAPIVWLGTRRLLDPLRALRDAIRRIRADPDATTRVPVIRQDEIGDLAADFNVLVEERQLTDRALRESEQRLRTITDNVPALIGYVDADLRYRYGNAAYYDWFGVSPEELNGRLMRELVGEQGSLDECLDQAFSGGLAELECTVAHPEGPRHTHVRFVPDVRDSRVVGIYILATDITALKRTERALQESAARLEHMARHDSLTGLPNRAALLERLEQALARGRRNQQTTAVLFLDVDRFKSINDTLGHAAGDLLLQQFAQRLSACIRETDTVARLGGDEFVIVLEGLVKPSDAETIARKILDTMRLPADLGGQRVEVRTSIGIATAPPGTDADALLASADGALYSAKNAGRNTYAVASARSRDVAVAA